MKSRAIKPAYILGSLGLVVAIFLIYWFAVRPSIFVAKCETESITFAQSMLQEYTEERAGLLDVMLENEVAASTRSALDLATEVSSLRQLVNAGGYQEDVKIDAYYSCLRKHGMK